MVIVIHVIIVVSNVLVLQISNVLTASLEIKMINKMMMMININIITDINMKEDAMRITAHCRLTLITIYKSVFLVQLIALIALISTIAQSVLQI